MAIKGLRILRWEDFSGGLNTKAGPGALAENEYPNALNIYLWERGIAKRKGYARYNGSARIATTSPGMGLIDAPFAAGNQIVGVAGTSIKVKGTNAWSDIIGSVSLTTGLPVQFVMQNNELVGVNGTNPGWYYTGTGTATTIDFENAPSAPTCAESFQGRLFMAQGRNLYWSPYMGDWRNGWGTDADQPFPENIIGLKILGDSNQSYMLVFCKHSIHCCIFDPSIAIQVGGSGTFRFDKITDKNGIATQFSIQECVLDDGTLGIIWADYDGLKFIDSSFRITKLTENVQPDWDVQNFAQIANARGLFFKQRRWYLYFYANGDSSTHNRVLVFDTRFWKPISFFDWQISHIGIVNISGVDSLIGGDYSGYWNQYDYGQNDNEAAIDAYIFSRVQDGGYPFTDKGFKSIGIQYARLGNYPIDMQCFYDDSTVYGSSVTSTPVGAALDSFVLDQDVLAPAAILALATKEIYGRGRTVQLRMSNSGIDQPFRIHKMFIPYQMGRTSPL